MKWFFAVLMTRSAGLVLWVWGETCWNEIGEDCWRKKAVRSADVSLSRISWVMGREWEEKKTQAERKADT
jgi:hypothetical protein